MKRFKLFVYPLVILGISLIFLTGCNTDEPANDEIQIQCIEFVPNSFSQDGKNVGIDVDIASLAMTNAGVDFNVKLVDTWDEAYNATLKGPNKAILTIGYSAARKYLFKWAGPTSQGMYYIFAKKKTGCGVLISAEDSKKIESIAVVKNWLETITLEDMGFQNLVYFDSYDAALNAFKNDEVKSISSDFAHFHKKLPAGYYASEEVEQVIRYRTVFYYIAFSKDVDDAVVEKCQRALNTMIENQTTLSIAKNYLAEMTQDDVPSPIQLFTENAAPYNYYTGVGANMKIVGSSTDIVNEIQRRNGYTNKINLTNWPDAYATIQYLPYSAAFTTARTTEREALFQWVGPISSLRTCFYTLTKSGIKIETVEQAKALKSIATPKDWYTHEYMKTNGFQNIVTTTTPNEAFRQLVDGEVEAILLADSRVKWLMDNTGTASSDVTEHIEVINIKGYIAFSLNTPKSIVDKWQTNLDAMRADGTFKNIWETWYGSMPMP
jgi:polar amino acid transport system substrate-binding protein